MHRRKFLQNIPGEVLAPAMAQASKMVFVQTFQNVSTIDLFRQLALIGMNSFEAKKTFSKKNTF
jgi:hypothetical protein